MRNFFKGLWLLSGLLMIGFGIYALFHPGATLVSLVAIAGWGVLISGVINIVAYLGMGRYVLPGVGGLVEGILTSLAGVLMLGNQYFLAEMIPYLIAIWIIASGAVRLFSSVSMAKKEVVGWGWVMLLGIGAILLGIVIFIRPLFAAMTMGIIVGVLLIENGVSNLAVWNAARRMDL
jgi:uncharacterized membrane protein HdeD (DUF308 family)